MGDPAAAATHNSALAIMYKDAAQEEFTEAAAQAAATSKGAAKLPPQPVDDPVLSTWAGPSSATATSCSITLLTSAEADVLPTEEI
jgi:hypothetical protein